MHRPILLSTLYLIAKIISAAERRYYEVVHLGHDYKLQVYYLRYHVARLGYQTEVIIGPNTIQSDNNKTYDNKRSHPERKQLQRCRPDRMIFAWVCSTAGFLGFPPWGWAPLCRRPLRPGRLGTRLSRTRPRCTGRTASGSSCRCWSSVGGVHRNWSPGTVRWNPARSPGVTWYSGRQRSGRIPTVRPHLSEQLDTH